MAAMTVNALFEVDVVVDAHTSGGAYALLDVRAAAGAAVARHVGADEEVSVHLLSGRVALRVGREERVLEAGAHALLPRGVPRAARVEADSRLLLLFVPAGPERLAPLLDDPPADADDVAALLAAAGFSRLPD
jgi:quercetin dioxygenase-like cupin family protein